MATSSARFTVCGPCTFMVRPFPLNASYTPAPTSPRILEPSVYSCRPSFTYASATRSSTGSGSGEPTAGPRAEW